MFRELRKELDNYEDLVKESPESYEDMYMRSCAELDIAKAFVYDLGYTNASKFARAILALGEIVD